MILFPIAVADELLIYDLIPTSLLLQLEAGRNFETFIASTSSLKPLSSTDVVDLKVVYFSGNSNF